MRSRRKDKGSALLMIVGLLTILALLGTTFLVSAWLDSQTSRALAEAAPITMESVARTQLTRLVDNRQRDLHIDGDGVYGAIDEDGDGNPGTSASGTVQVARSIDYPEDAQAASPADISYDFLLASTELQPDGTWRHVSNPFVTDPNDWFSNVDPNEAAAPDITGDGQGDPLVDTDGDGVDDARLLPAGIRDADNREYYFAVRMIDLGGLVNVNTAFAPLNASSGTPMPLTSASLWGLVGEVPVSVLHADRSRTFSMPPSQSDIAAWNADYVRRVEAVTTDYPDFDLSDLVSLRWTPYAAADRTGRLHWHLETHGLFDAARADLTPSSAFRICTRRSYTAGSRDHRVDLNQASATDLAAAFEALLGHIANAADRQKMAGQLAVNVVDFRDADDTPTSAGAGGTTVYGVERQPFLVEAGYKRESDGSSWSIREDAIELYNPCGETISMDGWTVECGGSTLNLGNTDTIGAGDRYVIATSSSVAVDGSATTKIWSSLDLSQTVTITRPTTGAGDACVAQVVPSDFADRPDQMVPGPPPGVPNGETKIECIRRCDRRDEAVYSIAKYKTGIEDDITVSTGANASNLGKPNNVSINDGQLTWSGMELQPCPVYVRNGAFINVGELARIYSMGPGGTQSLAQALALTSEEEQYQRPSNGRLGYFGGIEAGGWNVAGEPDVPLGCRAADFFMVASPLLDGVDNDGDGNTDNAGEDTQWGKINVNTATADALACLPGIAGLPGGDISGMSPRERMVREIIAYRDLADNSAAPSNGSNYTAGRSGLISNLRNEAGFASSGELAIPLAVRGEGSGMGAAQLPLGNYASANAEPNNYAVSSGGTDDGLPTSGNSFPDDDLAKRLIYYAWMSNQADVRSDVYLAYIHVQAVAAGEQPDPDATTGVATWLAVIDRSNCRTTNDIPRTRLFVKMR